MNEFQVVVRRDFTGMSIYMVRPTGTEIEFLSIVDGKEVLTKSGSAMAIPDTVKPLLTVPMGWDYQHDFSQKLLKALVETGLHLPDKNFAQGKLEAMEKHLEDMRTLLFKH